MEIIITLVIGCLAGATLAWLLRRAQSKAAQAAIEAQLDGPMRAVLRRLLEQWEAGAFRRAFQLGIEDAKAESASSTKSFTSADVSR